MGRCDFAPAPLLVGHPLGPIRGGGAPQHFGRISPVELSIQHLVAPEIEANHPTFLLLHPRMMPYRRSLPCSVEEICVEITYWGDG